MIILELQDRYESRLLRYSIRSQKLKVKIQNCFQVRMAERIKELKF